ncbi:MAG: sensor histidine kinase [Candidatus Aminicenantales bacterium]
MTKARIMVVEDDSIIAESIKSTLQSFGYVVPSVVSSGEEALERSEKDSPDLVLMDIVLKGAMDGIEAAHQIRNRFQIPIVFLTAFSDKKILERAKITEPFGYIIKPFEDRELHSIIEIALYKHRMERKLKENEEWLFTTLKSIGDAVIVTDTQSRMRFMNPVAESLTGWKQKEAFEKPLREVFNIISEKTGKRAEDPVSRVLRKGAIVGLADRTLLITKDGQKLPIDDSAAPIKDDRGKVIGIVLVFRDITERRKSEEKIRASLAEKEVLLKEIHHRVKNNLQIVHSLLNIQSEYIKNKSVLNMLRETQDRVRSMALIHEKLYQSKDLARIEFGDYIQRLIDGLFHSYGIVPESIKLEIDVKDIFLDINSAIPCGLIINELVSNSIKHAFPDGKGGSGRPETQNRICVMMKRRDNKYTLTMSDNGVGIPEHLDFRDTESLGLQVVNTLVEQLEGSIELIRHGGTSFKIEFFP